jgi:putative transposase
MDGNVDVARRPHCISSLSFEGVPCLLYNLNEDPHEQVNEAHNTAFRSDLKRMKEMEQELFQLKRMYADMALENRALKDLIEKKL